MADVYHVDLRQPAARLLYFVGYRQAIGYVYSEITSSQSSGVDEQDVRALHCCRRYTNMLAASCYCSCNEHVGCRHGFTCCVYAAGFLSPGVGCCALLCGVDYRAVLFRLSLPESIHSTLNRAAATWR
jgi:hypothetical protein